MKFALQADRPTIVVGTTLGLLALLVLYGVLHFWLLRQSYVREIEAIEPRTARLLGLQESQQDLEIAGGIADTVLRDLVYTAGRDSAGAASTMQREVREVLSAAGMTVTGSQILPARPAEGYERLSLDVTAQGNIDALDAALSELEQMRPLVLVESVRLKPTRDRSTREATGDPRMVQARFSLFSLRLQR